MYIRRHKNFRLRLENAAQFLGVCVPLVLVLVIGPVGGGINVWLELWLCWVCLQKLGGDPVLYELCGALGCKKCPVATVSATPMSMVVVENR